MFEAPWSFKAGQHLFFPGTENGIDKKPTRTKQTNHETLNVTTNMTQPVKRLRSEKLREGRKSPNRLRVDLCGSHGDHKSNPCVYLQTVLLFVLV